MLKRNQALMNLPVSGYRIVLLALLLSCSGEVAAQAVGLSGDALYEGRVTLEERDSESRRDGIREAGLDVLARITGRRDPESVEALEPIRNRFADLVERYQWETGEDGDPRLWVRFDSEAIDRAVRDSGQPLWGRERPRVLVWLAMRDDGERGLVTEDEIAEKASSIADAARERGVPLIFPLMDLEDRSRVGFADVWGGFDDRVQEASRRYRPNAILIGRVEGGGGDDWRGRWSLYQPDGVLQWRGEVAPKAEALADGIHEMADRLARRFAVTGESGSDDVVRLRVRGLAELEDYVRAEQHLDGLTPVESVRLESLTGDAAVFRIQTRGGRVSLEQSIELQDRLAPMESVETDDEDAALSGMVPVDVLPTYRLRQ